MSKRVVLDVFYNRDDMHPFDLNGILVYENIYDGLVNNIPSNKVKKVPFENLFVTQGDNRTLRVYVKNPSNEVIDLTGASALLTFRESSTSDDASIQLSTEVPAEGMIGAADRGEIFFFIVPANTNTLELRQYVWDCRVTLASGKVYTVLNGVMDLGNSVDFGVLNP
jgi:hypothetical protein